MKKRMLGFAAVMIAGMLALCGCESSNSTGGADGVGNSQSVSGTQQVNGKQVSGQDTNGTQTEKNAASADGIGSQNMNGTDGNNAGSTQNADTSAENVNDSGMSAGADSGANEAADEQNGQNAAQDIWSGTYIGGEENVTLTLLGDGNISFAFAQSGIAGTAEVKGSQAVFHGDDHYVVVFNINDTVLDVSVSSEEDDDASESPLIGTYVKEAE